MRFTPDVYGLVTAIRFFKATGATGTHVGTIWTAAGKKLGTVTFTGESEGPAWQQQAFASPVIVHAGEQYIASVFMPDGAWRAVWNYFSASGVDNPPLSSPASTDETRNGVYEYASAEVFPGEGWASNYWIDVVFRKAETAIGCTIQ